MKLFSSIKRYAAIPVASGLAVVASFPAWAAGDVAGPTDWAPIISAMTAQISISTIVGVLASTVVTGISLVFMWWGARKAVRALMGAFRKGKLSV